MTWSDPRARTAIAATIAACAAIAAFAPTIPAQVWTGDTAEAQTVPYILGIAHPTGFPAYTLLGWVFSHAVAVGTVAWRLNLFTTLCVALVAACIVLLAAALECNPFAAIAAALVFVFGAVVRREAVLASAHSLSSLCCIAALVACVWYAKRGGGRALVAACACAGLGLATHPVSLWVLPAIAVAMAWQWRALTRRTAALAAVALLAPLLLYLYLPIRSNIVAAQHLDPTAGAPLFGAGAIDWDTNQPRTLDGFLDEVLGRQVRASKTLQRALNPSKAPAAMAFWATFAKRQYAVWLLVLAAIGAVALAQRDRRGLSVLIAGTFGALLFAGVYQSDSGISWYLVLSFAVTAVFAAAATRLQLPSASAKVVAASGSIALVILAAFAWQNGRPRIPLAALPGGEVIVDAVARDVPDGAIVVADWYEATALGYGAAVEHALGTRTIIVALPAQYVERYPIWARARRVVIYAGGLELFSLEAVPRSWRHELPSGNLFYRVVEVVPPPAISRRTRADKR